MTEVKAAFFVRSPGRVNLIGEHTDYNAGFVMPLALERGTTFQVQPRDDQQLIVHALRFNAHDQADLANLAAGTHGDWRDYVRGTAQALLDAGYALQGAEINIDGDLPLSGGLSSSASLEVGLAFSLLHAQGITIAPAELAKIAQRAEIEYAHVNCGIMDQLSIAAGVAGHATLIDCRSLEIEAVPIPAEVAVLVIDSGVPRTLAGSAYNQRRAECEQAVAILQQLDPSINDLRDVSSTLLAQAVEQDRFEDVIYRRARHVVSENERVHKAAAAFRTGDFGYVGELMNESHWSLRDDYEVSGPELDQLTELLRDMAGVWGARLTGAGFGGCCVALVEASQVDTVIAALGPAYHAATGRTCEAFSTKASALTIEEPRA
ncbi:galactokinase [Herpetosiphon gulosus]|uniref:Galactokinase n=1 Tax=Herpetosiphon gulosus TaxID=1973496 RepID=A0ABP9WUU9_9CHLR